MTAVAKPGAHDSQLVLEQVNGALIAQESDRDSAACGSIAESRNRLARLVTRSKDDMRNALRTYLPIVSLTAFGDHQLTGDHLNLASGPEGTKRNFKPAANVRSRVPVKGEHKETKLRVLKK